MPDRRFTVSAQTGAVITAEYPGILAAAFRMLNENLDKQIDAAGYEPIGEHINSKTEPYPWGDEGRLFITITSEREGRSA